MDKISFPYRSSTHLPLLYVIGEGGFWEKYGLAVDYEQRISSADAHDAVARGDIEFVGGNHVTTYGRRARGDGWVYLGQTINTVPGRKLVVREDSNIDSVSDLRGKVVAQRGMHPTLNDWLFLKQRGLDTDRDEVALADLADYAAREKDPNAINTAELRSPTWHAVRDKKADATFLVPPATEFARDAGLKLIDVDPFPMIYFTTISTGLQFAKRHPDIVDRFLRGIIEGVHFFKTQREKAIAIIERRYAKEGKLSRKAAELTHRVLAENLESSLFPALDAIANVYQEAVRRDKDAIRVNPMELWDLHYLRNIADSGFAKRLYAGS